MSSCSKCFSQFHTDDDAMVIEAFQDYSAGIYNKNDNPYYNYLSAMQAIYNPPDYMVMMNPQRQNRYRGGDVYECFENQVDADVQQQLFNMGDYQDFYHNLYDNV